MLGEYFPILLFILVGILVGVALPLAGRLLAPNRPDPDCLACSYTSVNYRLRPVPTPTVITAC